MRYYRSRMGIKYEGKEDKKEYYEVNYVRVIFIAAK
jgi:hypothetical protein